MRADDRRSDAAAERRRAFQECFDRIGDGQMCARLPEAPGDLLAESVNAGLSAAQAAIDEILALCDLLATGDDAKTIVDREGLVQITDTGALETIIDALIAANGKQVEQYRGGQEKLLGFFVGQVMKASGGKANPGEVNKLLKRLLGEG